MKSHSKASPQRSCLATSSCWRFSPTRLDPRLGQRAHLLQRHVLGRGEDLDPVAGDARAPARGSRRSWPARARGSGRARQPSSALDPGKPALPAGATAVAPVGEEELRLAAGAELGGLDRSTPACAQQAPRHLRAGRAFGPWRLRPPDRRMPRAPRPRPRSSRRRFRARSRRRVALTASAPRATMPAARPRQPQWSIATPPGPATRHRQAVGGEDERRQAGLGDDWPSTSGIGCRSARGSVLWRRRETPARRRAPGGRSTIWSGGSQARRRAAAVLDHRVAASSVKTPRLRPSKGASLTPPMRVEKAARAPGSSASSQRTPSGSRHSIASLRARLQRATVELLVASGDLAVELAPQRLVEAAADRRALRDAGGDQFLAVDLERDVAPLGQVLVEPLGTQRPREDQLDWVAPLAPAAPPRRSLGATAASASSSPQGPSAAARTARSRGASLARAGSRAAPQRRRPARPRPRAAPRGPTRRAGQDRARASASPASRSSSASRRSTETVLRSASRSRAAVSGSSSKPKRAA